jgi:glycyl-tRNA synthetase
VAIETPALSDGTTRVELPKELLSISKTTRLQNTREYIPGVIEPSFGIGRIFYSLLEHVYWYRPNDTARAVSTRIH